MAHLFPEFSAKTKAEWLAKVERDLKGKPLDSLDWSPFEGLTMTPFFHPEDLPQAPRPLANGRQGNTWEIGERIIVNEVKTANRQALEALEGGVTALGFQLNSPGDLSTLLDGIQHELVSTNFYFSEGTPLAANGAPQNFTADFHRLVVAKKQDPAKVTGTLFPPPTGLGEGLRASQKLLPQFRFVHIRGEYFYQSNGLPAGKNDPAAELAQMLAAANGHLRQLTDEGLRFDEVASSLQFSLAIGINYFLAIAKIRALKLLWENLAEGYGEENVPCPPIEVHLAPASQTNDADTNKIGATTQAMAAVIGGADRLYLLPSDAFENAGGTSFSRRIARNVQHLLQLESYLDRVADPAAGSYFIENLTDALAERAWKIFIKNVS